MPIHGEGVMRQLYVVTHTEATHHVDNLVGGWYDSALTPRGLDDADRLAAALDERLPVDGGVSLFASDLLRARETADRIALRLGADVVLDPNLRERSYGVAEGKAPGSFPVVPPPRQGDRIHHHDGVDGSETRFEWASRAYAALDRVVADGRQHSVVVTHGGTASHLVAAWIGLPIEADDHAWFTVTSGSITHLQDDDFYHDHRVVALNDRSHLG